MPDDAPGPGDRVVVAGASGLIGTALTEALRADGIRVVHLVRRAPRTADEVGWNPGDGPLDPAVLAGATAVVGLNGASIGRFPWTAGYRAQLRSSRVDPTRTLATALRTLGDDAPLFVSASAVGVYGAAPTGEVTESSPAGDNFLARLCVEWEDAAREAGDRVALLRTAPVVARDGVLAPLILLTRAGLSGRLGPGTQVWPWISLDDEVRGIRHVVDRGLTGPVNLVGPRRATASDLGFALAVGLNRPYIVPAPSWALRLGLGREAADAVLLTDADVAPTALTASGFTFTHPTVDDAVAAALAD